MDEATRNEAAASAAALVRSVFDGTFGENAGMFVAAVVTNDGRVAVRDTFFNLSLAEVAAIIHDAATALAAQPSSSSLRTASAPRRSQMFSSVSRMS